MQVNEKIIRVIGKSKVQRQLYYIYLAVLSIPVFLIGIFLIINTRKLLLEHYQTQIRSDNLRVRSIMYDITAKIYDYSNEIISEESLIKLITDKFATESEAHLSFQGYSKLNNILNNAAISLISIYTTNQTIGTQNTTNLNISSVDDHISGEDWYQKALSQYSSFWISSSSYDSGGNENYELTFVRKIPLISSADTAVLSIKVSSYYLKNRIQNTNLFITTTINDDPIFFSTEKSLQNTILPVYIDYRKGYCNYSGDINYSGNDVIGEISTLQPYGTDDYLYITTLDFEAYPAIEDIIKFCIGIILLSTLVSACIIFIYTKYFSSRVYALRQAMSMASHGEYGINQSFNGNDELSETFTDLNIMIQNIKEKDALMFEEQMKKQKLKNEQQKIEFKMLASQINPHFLYNTLETIRMQALTAGNKDVATSIKLLGKSMHYVLENTGTASTTLKNELDYIHTYLTIQKLRFNDRVNYTLKAAGNIDLSNYHILPLLLQPIVENAILHGLEGIEENGQITIEVETVSNEYLKILISDNGAGMSLDELEALRQAIGHNNMSSATSIGLYNINQRIKLCYGSDYSMQIESSPGEGTKVLLLLPLNETLEE